MKKAFIIGMFLPLTALAQATPSITLKNGLTETATLAEQQKAALDLKIDRVFDQSDSRSAVLQVVAGSVDGMLYKGLNSFIQKGDVDKIAEAQEKLSKVQALQTQEQIDAQIQIIKNNILNYDEVEHLADGQQKVVDMVMTDDAKAQIESLQKDLAVAVDLQTQKTISGSIKQIELDKNSYIHTETEIPENSQLISRQLKANAAFDIERLEGKKSALLSEAAKKSEVRIAAKALSAAKGTVIAKLGRAIVNTTVYAGKAIVAIQFGTRLYIMTESKNLKNPGAAPLLTLTTGKSLTQCYNEALLSLSDLMTQTLK